MELRKNVCKYVIGTDHLNSEVRHNSPVTSCRYLPGQWPAVSRHKRHVRPTAQVAFRIQNKQHFHHACAKSMLFYIRPQSTMETRSKPRCIDTHRRYIHALTINNFIKRLVLHEQGSSVFRGKQSRRQHSGRPPHTQPSTVRPRPRVSHYSKNVS